MHLSAPNAQSCFPGSGPLGAQGLTLAARRRHPFAPIKAPVFLGSSNLLIAPFLKVGLAAVSKEHAPCCFEVGAGLVEGGRGAVRVTRPVSIQDKSHTA